jgi:phage baseplate assembly protein W
MSSVGIDQNTGKVLVGWPHVAQSINKIVMTEIGSRVERRDFGSGFGGLIDKPQNAETTLAFFMAIAEALEPRLVRSSIYGEPRFSLTAIRADLQTPGILQLSLMGDYYPDGHREAFTEAQQRELIIMVPAAPLN